MNPESYFEMDPWSYAADLTKAGDLGMVKALSVQATVGQGLLMPTSERWQSRLSDLLGSSEQCDVLETESAMSVLIRFPNSVIARLFFDEGPGEPVCAFEIIGDRGLLVWRPDVHRLSWMQTVQQSETICEHPYATALGEEIAP